VAASLAKCSKQKAAGIFALRSNCETTSEKSWPNCLGKTDVDSYEAYRMLISSRPAS
jgi:hypothetical protein